MRLHCNTAIEMFDSTDASMSKLGGITRVYSEVSPVCLRSLRGGSNHCIQLLH